MGLLNWLKKGLSPKDRIAALVDSVVDRLNDKYHFEGHITIVDGGFKFGIWIADKAPNLPKVDLDEVAKAE